MTSLINIFCLLHLLAIALPVVAQQKIQIEVVNNIPHPRILLLEGEEQKIHQTIEESNTWKKVHEAIVNESNQIIGSPPIERIQIGRRLLYKSREALRRIFYLSYAWRMTGDQKYFNRCEKEMLVISNFSDWNPSHFLDVAEMTMAVAIGYDWLFTKLSPESKRIISEAIISKGLNPSLDSKYNNWQQVTNNWNQVCNAGMTYGALAVAEDNPELAQIIIERALNTIHLSMDEYKPDGAYPEGYHYWGYGTSFNVMFLSAIEAVFKSDFGLNKIPGFLQTGKFLQNMTGPVGPCFNWGDCRLGIELNPSMFWFALKSKDNSQLWVEKGYLQCDDFSIFTCERLLPTIIIWGTNLPQEKIANPKLKAWKGQGVNPVALMRTSWTDPNAIYVGFKAGSPSANHGHMDVGSFIMESDGVRWASDFGMQEYESLESKGIQLFGRTQDAQRWTVFRLNNFVHNTLTIDNQLQQVKGYAKIDRFSDNPKFMYAASDISSVYKNQLESAWRGIAIVDGKFVVVSDELIALNKPITVRWTMLTTAVPTFGDKSINLTKDGKTLNLIVNTEAMVTMKTWLTTPTTTYDAPNPGTTLVGFEMQLEPREKQEVQVLLIPGSKKHGRLRFRIPLEEW